MGGERVLESRYFCRKIFSGILLEKIGKNHATAYAFGAPIRPRHLVPTQQGAELWFSHDLTPFRDALQVFFASLRKPARRYGYRGLKIFTSLALRFQDFQRPQLIRILALWTGVVCGNHLRW